MATKIKTGQIVDIETYVDNKDNIVISTAAADATTKANAAETNSKAYTDLEVASFNSTVSNGDAATLAAAQLDATTKANAAQANANSYTDTEIASSELSMTTYIDAQDAAVLIDAKEHAVIKDAINLQIANLNAQSWDVETLQAAKDYTDTQTGSSAFGALKYEDAYTNGVISGFIIPTSVTLDTTIGAGIAYVESIRQNVLATPHTFTASVDTYVDLDVNGLYVYNEVALGAGAPAISVGNIRIALVTTDATSITTVTDLSFKPSFYESDAEITTAAQPYIDAQDAATLSSANTYTDGEIITLTGYVDTQDNAVLSAAGAYTDIEITTLTGYVDTQDALKQDISEKGQINGYASLDANGLVPSAQLPSFVDDVLEFTDLASFPVTGETGKIYVSLATNLTYRWSGSAYIELTDTTAIWGNISGTLSNQTDLQNALDLKADITYVDTQDAATLASANNYTDNELLNYTPTTTLTTLLAAKASLDTAVSFNTITPTTDELYDLGSSALYWNNVYTKEIKPWYDGVTSQTLTVKGEHFTSINITTDKTGTANSDPVLALIDSTAGINWSIRNDSSDLNSLDFRYNNVRKFNIDSNGAFTEFTKLGADAPAIKTKKLTGTTAATSDGAIVTVAHGLNSAKIISFTLKIAAAASTGIPAQFTGVAGYEASIYHDGTNFIIENISGNSASIVSKPLIIFVTYEA